MADEKHVEEDQDETQSRLVRLVRWLEQQHQEGVCDDDDDDV